MNDVHKNAKPISHDITPCKSSTVRQFSDDCSRVARLTGSKGKRAISASMMKTSLWITAAFAIALFAGPLAFVASHVGKTDGGNLYVMLWNEAGDDLLTAFGARQIGPERSALAQLIEAMPDAKNQLLQAGYLLVPAGSFAALCAGPSTLTRTS